MQITDLVYIDSTGYHFADYPAFLEWRKQQLRDIYGADIYLESDSQDGQLVAIQAKADYDTAAQGAATFNSFSPVTAQGAGLSRVVKINGLTRHIPTRSTVDVLIVGTAGTVITNGVAVDTLQQKWNLPATVTIPGGGSITVTATADVVGAIAAEANTVTGIFTPTRGWQTVNNVAAATAGAPVETDAELRLRQQVSTANPSLTVFDGTIGGVANLTGVTKVRGYENDTGATDGNGIPAHKISLVVLGGDTTAIAQEIALHKTPGTGTYGTTSALVYDAHGMPLTIAFYRPTAARIYVNVTVASTAAWSSDYIALLKAAIAAQINSTRIGDSVIYTAIFGPAYLPGTPASGSYTIAVLEIKKGGGGYVTTNLAMLFNENPNCDVADIAVTVT